MHIFLLSLLLAFAVLPAAGRQVGARDSIVLDTVTVVSSQRQRDLAAPMPVYHVAAADFRRQGITTVADAVHRLPGTTLRDYGGAGGMKTVSVRGFGAAHTAVTYDGMPLGDCQTGQVDLSRYSIATTRSLALTIGDTPDPLLPARAAAAAATLAITSATETSLALTAGSWGHIQPAATLALPLGRDATIALTGEYLHADNNYPYDLQNVAHTVHARRLNNTVSSGHAELNFRYRQLLTVKAYYYDNSRDLPGMAHYYVNDSQEHTRDQNAFAFATLRLPLAERWQLAAAAKFDYAMSSYTDPLYPNHVQDHHYQQREAYATTSIAYRPHETVSIGYAIDYFHNALTGGDQTEYRSPRRNAVLQALTATYSAHRLTATARALLSLYYNTAAEGRAANDARRLSPSFSLAWQPTDSRRLFLRLTAKSIFRVPTFNESYYRHYGTADLRPERTEQLGLGATYSNAAVTLTADAYIGRVKDKIVAIPRNMYVWANVNLGRVNTAGVDLTATYTTRLATRTTLLASGNYSWQRVRNATNPDSPYYGLQTAYTPEHSGAASIAVEHPWLSAAVACNATAERWSTNEHNSDTRLEPYADCTASLYRDFRLARHTLTARLDVHNVFDTQYEVVRFYPMPSRQWLITLTFK